MDEIVKLVISGAIGGVPGGVIGAYLKHKFADCRSRQAARDAALGAIEELRLNIQACPCFRSVIAAMRQRSQSPVLDFAHRCNGKSKDRIMSAWQEYQKISDWDVDPDNPIFRDAQTPADKARTLLLEPLGKLRDEIQNA